jgi:SAM-dependent methyltransferase
MIDPWYGDEGFWLDAVPVIFDQRRWAEREAVAGLLARLLTRVGAPRGSSVMDALCGVGRITVALAEEGYAMTGVDLCGPYLDAAADSARAAGVECRFLKSDIRQIGLAGEFDAAINTYNSFGYLETAEDDLAMAAAIRRSLKPGGAFVIDVFGKEIIERDFIASDSWEPEGSGASVSVESRFRGDREYLEQLWRIESGGRVSERLFTQRLYSAPALEALFMRAGFEDVEISGSLDGKPYDGDAIALCAVCRTRA